MTETDRPSPGCLGRRRRTFVPAAVRGRRGVTLVELMIAVAVLSTVAMSVALAYTQVMRAMVLSKTRGVAARLAQDKFETLRGLSYANLMVTTQADLDVNPPGVDQTYYPPETMDMAGKTFTRLTVVYRVYRDSSGSIIPLSPNASDTGLKQIKVLVKFMVAGVEESRSYTVLISDLNLVPLDGTLYGLVKDTAGVALANVKVFVTENQNWYALSSSTGYYQISMDTRPYTATAVRAGYWDKVSSTFAAVGAKNVDFQLTARQMGRVTGTINARPPGLLISGVFAGSSLDGNSHFLELYNPTTYPILVTDGFAAKIQVKWIPSDNSVNAVSFAFGDASPHSIPSQGYFLIATASPTINGKAPDALFSLPTSPFLDRNKGGVAVQNSFGVAFDTLGWTNDLGGGQPGPSNGIETRGVYVGGGSNWGGDGFLNRKSDPSGVTLGVGNSVDSGSNTSDALLFASVGAGFPRNSLSAAATVQYGVPAASATVLATDGYSAAVTASGTGYFLLTGVTTGTWSVAAYYTRFSTNVSPVAVNTGATTVVNLFLDPSSSGRGGVSGRAVRSDTLAAIPSIRIGAGTSSTLTDPAGNYILSLDSGAYTVGANVGFDDINYNTLSSTMDVPAGSVKTGADFHLEPSGVVTGKATTNGTDPYPNLPMHALTLGLEVATAMTDSAGNYTLYGVPAGLTMIAPVMDTQAQSSNPSAVNLTVTQGTTHSGNNFTVTDSLGKIMGTVKAGGSPITTGVLVVASTTPVASLPTLDSSYRAGGNVLYSVVSDAAGNYSVNVVRNSTYTVYAYYTTIGGAVTATSAKYASNVYVTGTKQADFIW